MPVLRKLDRLHVLAHRAIDFGNLRQLFTSDRPGWAGISTNLRPIDGEIDTF